MSEAVYPFLTQLAELCHAERTRVKWVLVPGHALGHTLGERLALAGMSWANLRFSTPFDLALQMAAPFLVERGIAPAVDQVGPVLIMRLLPELPAGTPQYFRHLAEQPKMAEALWSTIRELRMAGLGAQDLPAEAFSSPDKHAELTALLTAYEAHLASQRLADAAAVCREALQHLDVCPILPGDCWTELPGPIWAPLERRLLDALPAERLIPQSLRIQGLTVPERVNPGAQREPMPRTDSELLTYLMNPAEAPPAAGDGTLTMFRAGGKEAEVEEVFRRILRDGVPLDHVEIACASPDYVALLWEKTARHGWPVTVGPGVPIAFTRPARALLAFCDWVEGGFPSGGLRRLLQSGDLRVELADGPTAGQAARLLAQSDATWGRQTYGAAMAALAISYRERAADPESDPETRMRYTERAGQAGRLAAWIAQLLELVPEPDAEGRLGVDALIAGCAGFIGAYAAKHSELDGSAAAVLADSLADLRAVGGLELPAGEAFALIRHQVDGIAVGGDRARPGHLFVTTLRRAGYTGRAFTFVVGLEEGRVFPALLEDAVLLDPERRAISGELPTSGDRATEALHGVVSRLASLGGQVCLSFSCRDLRQHRETFPSWLLLQAQRVLKPGRDWSYQELNEELGEPVSTVPPAADQALSEAGWWLANLNGLGADSLAGVHRAFPWLRQGEAAEEARESEAFTIYDGLVPAAGRRLDPRRSERPVSATTLEKLAECPFRHFLERGLGLEPIEEAEPDRDRWLDAATRGVVLHALYAAILRELRDSGAPLDLTRHGQRLRQLGGEKLRELRALVPPPSDAVFGSEAHEFLRDLDLFLRLHAGERGRTPVGFEVSFGAGPADGEPLAQPEPVTIDLGAGLRFLLRGRIDRIDRLADGTYEVIDYKTGWYRPDAYDGTFLGGRLLQHGLYALAATQLLGRQDPTARVSASTYYHPTARGQAERVVYPAFSPVEVAAVLRGLFDILAAGAFVHTAEKADCRWCKFGRACGGNPLGRAGKKLKAASNTVLGPYRDLNDRE